MSVLTNLTSVNCTKWTCSNESDVQFAIGAIELNMSPFILSALIALGNALNLLTIRQNYRLRTTFDMYLVSLASAGLLNGLCVILTETNSTRSAYKYLCLSIVSLQAISGMATMTSMTLLSIDRCVSVTFPLFYKTAHTKTKALLTILGSWAGNSIYGCLNFWFNRFSADVKCSFMTVADIWYVRYLSSTLIITLIATNIVCCVKIACACFRTKWPMFNNKRQKTSGVPMGCEPELSNKMARYDSMMYSILPLCTFVQTNAAQIENTPRTFAYEIDEEIVGQKRYLSKQDFQDTSCSLLKSGSLSLEGRKVSHMCDKHLINPTQTTAFQEKPALLQSSGLKFSPLFYSLCDLKYQQNYGLGKLLIPLNNPLKQRKSTTNLLNFAQLSADNADKKGHRSLPTLTRWGTKTGAQKIDQKHFDSTCSYHTTKKEKNKPKNKCENSTSASYCLKLFNLSLESAVLRNTEIQFCSHPRILNRTFGSEQKLSAPSTKSSEDDFLDETNIEPYFELNSKAYVHLNSSHRMHIHGDSIAVISDETEIEPNSSTEHVVHSGASINISNSSKSSSPIADLHRLKEEPNVPKTILAKAQSKCSCQIVSMLLLFQTMYILFFLPCLIIFTTFGLMVIPEWLTSLALLFLCLSNVLFTIIYMVFSARYRAIFRSMAKRLLMTCDLDH